MKYVIFPTVSLAFVVIVPSVAFDDRRRAMEDRVNATLDSGLEAHKIAAKAYLFPPIADLGRGSPDLPPVSGLKRQETQHVGILLVGLDPTAGLAHLFELVTVRQVRIEARLTEQIAQPAPAE